MTPYWTILEIIPTEDAISFDGDTTIYHNGVTTHQMIQEEVNKMASTGKVIIKTIARKKDHKVFTLGQIVETGYKNREKGKITEIGVTTDMMHVMCIIDKWCVQYLNEIN